MHENKAGTLAPELPWPTKLKAAAGLPRPTTVVVVVVVAGRVRAVWSPGAAWTVAAAWTVDVLGSLLQRGPYCRCSIRSNGFALLENTRWAFTCCTSTVYI